MKKTTRTFLFTIYIFIAASCSNYSCPTYANNSPVIKQGQLIKAKYHRTVFQKETRR